MKKLIVFPGNSPKNKAWGENIAFYFSTLFDSVYVVNYEHWVTGNETIDFDSEAEKIKERIEGDQNTECEYVIFAKSFGSILALKSIYAGYIKPSKCVFFGMPFNLVEEQNIFKGDWSPASSFSVPSIAFHNNNDPVALYAFTSKRLTELEQKNIKLIVTQGENHSYKEFESYEDDIKQYLQND